MVQSLLNAPIKIQGLPRKSARELTRPPRISIFFPFRVKSWQRGCIACTSTRETWRSKTGLISENGIDAGTALFLPLEAVSIHSPTFAKRRSLSLNGVG